MTIHSSRKTLIKDVHNLKQDAGQIVDDVKKHVTAHIETVKDKVNDTLRLTRHYAKEHPLKLIGVSLFIGFLVGTFRRK